ncbi:hypothetical protein Taro_013279 [Colocasia esculenta]|uniref:Uncharacterized protein n=1 Tax=Colocasia esculenta TaxID=4460 RepID=A0A843UBG6_COLES|nr:hypothetical protein [Colocasia esculenta]
MEPITLCSPSRVCLLQLPAARRTSFPVSRARHCRSSRPSRSRRFSVFCGGPVRDTRAPEEPSSNRGSRLRLPPALLPVLRSVGDFLLCQSRIARLYLRGGLEDGRIGGRDVACCGGLGTLLLSTTAAALSRARASPFLGTLAANPTFVSGLLAWALAQTTKLFLNFFVERRWDLGMLVSSGGMPSSHSALCTALTASVALCHGVGDALFPVCLGFTLIVMYDATGVRRHAGMQAAKKPWHPDPEPLNKNKYAGTQHDCGGLVPMASH